MGALLHYVQDVSVPVVPIFHPVRYLPPKADGFDSWDEFTPYPWQQDKSKLKKVCTQLLGAGQNSVTAGQIIGETLAATRDNILNGLESDRPQKNVWLKLYPVSAAKLHGFAQYGCNSEGDYGLEQVTCDEQAMNVSHSHYVAFASRQRDLAVQVSAQLIYVMQKHLSPCETEDCLGGLNDDRWLPNAKLLKALVKE